MLRKESWSADSAAGFTLFEVIVVMTLILLLTGLVYPGGITFKDRMIVKVSLAQLKDDILELQAQAFGGGDRPVLIFAPDSESYLIEIGTLSLERPLAGLTIDAEAEIKIVFSESKIADLDLIFRTANGVRYHLTLDDQNEPVIKSVH